MCWIALRNGSHNLPQRCSAPRREALKSRDWIDYTQLPDREELRGLYNLRIGVFAAPSRTGGVGAKTRQRRWPHGCALVTNGWTAARGLLAVDGDTALSSRAGCDGYERENENYCKMSHCEFAWLERGEQCARQFTHGKEPLMRWRRS